MAGSTPFPLGIVGALEEELAPLFAADGAPGASGEDRLGVRIRRTRIEGRDVRVARSGIGKVAAAHAAAALVADGARALLVVGTCGGLARDVPVGTLVHVARAVQWDLGVREGREFAADPVLLAAWRRAIEGRAGLAMTADRAAIRVIDRWRRARAAARAWPDPSIETSVADMETAAVAAVAARAGVPWAALRAVTDTLAFGRAASFLAHLPRQGGRAASSVPALIAELRRAETPST